MTMIQLTKLIQQDTLVSLLKDPNIVKIEIKKRDNKGLKDPDVVRVCLYLQVDKGLFGSFIGSVTLLKDKVPEEFKGFVTGMKSGKKNGFLKSSTIEEVASNLKSYNTGLPKAFMELINQYK